MQLIGQIAPVSERAYASGNFHAKSAHFNPASRGCSLIGKERSTWLLEECRFDSTSIHKIMGSLAQLAAALVLHTQRVRSSILMIPLWCPEAKAVAAESVMAGSSPSDTLAWKMPPSGRQN
jgi:hypothetical protein